MFKTCYVGCPKIEELSSPAPDLSAPLAAETDRIWEQAQAERPGAFFDGWIFSVEEVCGPTISGRFVPYRQFVAVRRRPELFSELPIRPLGVTGIIFCDDGIIFGRRGPNVNQDEELWELVPAGGLDPSCRSEDGAVDIFRQLTEECREEVGLGAESISGMEVQCVVEDTAEHVFDVVAHIHANMRWQDLNSTIRRAHHDEHSEFKYIGVGDAAAFLNAQGERGAPLSRYIVEHHLS